MKNALYSTGQRWEHACGVLMLAALAVTVLGSLVLLKSQPAGGPMGGLGDGLGFFVWAFGVAGLVLCYLEDAKGRQLLAKIGFGWSALALSWNAINYQCSERELCLHDASDNGFLLAICAALLLTLHVFGKKKERIPAAGQFAIKVFARSLLVVWVCALLFVVVTFNKPLPLRIDHAPHPIVQESRP